MKGNYKKAEEGLFSRICNSKTRGNSFKLKEGKLTLDFRKNLLTKQMLCFPVNAKVFEARMAEELKNLV